MDLLSRLNRWAYRQDENFMTEAFVCLLLFLQEHEQVAAVQLFKKISNGHIDVTAADCNEVTIVTQITTNEGRPDIEIKSTTSLGYIEVKSESGLGHDQLKRYRSSLSKSGYTDTFLILLTKYPVENGSNHHKPDLYLRWSDIYEHLSQLTISNDLSRYVVDQFMQFLEAKGIVMDHVSWQLVEGVKSLHNLLNMIGKAIEHNSIKSKPLSGGKEYIGYYTEGNRCWVGIYYNQPAYLLFELNLKKTIDSKNLAKLGLTDQDQDRPDRVFISIDLSNELNHFFSRDRTSQLKYLESKIAEWRDLEVRARKNGY